MTKQMKYSTGIEQIPEGYKLEYGYVIPKEWKIVRFDKCFHRLTRKNAENNQNVLTISAQQGLISQLDYYNTLYASEDKTGYFLLQKGDFAYNKSYSTDYAYGAIKQLEKYEKGIVSPLYICFSANKDTNTDFYRQYFEGGRFNREIYKIAQEGARNHGLLNVSTPEFFSAALVYPPVAEQKKIAEILAQCDKVIELKRQRIEEEKNKKKWILAETMKMLKGILGSSNKYTGTLEDLVSKIETGTSVNSIDDVNSTIDSNHKFVLKTSAICDGVFIETECKKVVPEDYNRASCAVESGTLLVSRMNTPKLVGACAVCYKSLPNVYLPDRLWKVSVKATADPRWLNYILNSAQYKNLIQERAGGTSNSMKNISQKDFLGLPISPPPYEKQVIIGDTLSSIDNLIQKLEEEEDAWMQKKKLMTQLLLTGIVRVKS